MNGPARESAFTNADPNTRGSSDECVFILFNSEAREWRHDSENTQTNKLKW